MTFSLGENFFMPLAGFEPTTLGPNHPSCGSSGERGGYWVKIKMAQNKEFT